VHAILGLGAQALLQLRDGGVNVAVVELDALDRIALARAPVARFEALRGAPRDRAELRVVVGERRGDESGSVEKGDRAN